MAAYEAEIWARDPGFRVFRALELQRNPVSRFSDAGQGKSLPLALPVITTSPASPTLLTLLANIGTCDNRSRTSQPYTD